MTAEKVDYCAEPEHEPRGLSILEHAERKDASDKQEAAKLERTVAYGFASILFSCVCVMLLDSRAWILSSQDRQC